MIIKLSCIAVMALLAVFLHGAASARQPDEDAKLLQGRVLKQAKPPLNRVSMVEVTPLNYYQQQLIHMHHVGMRASALSIYCFPSPFKPDPGQPTLLQRYDVNAAIVSAEEGNLVNERQLTHPSKMTLLKAGSGVLRLSAPQLVTSSVPQKNAAYMVLEGK